MIIEISELYTIRQKNRHKKIVYINGVFDLLHDGHLALISKAKELGEIVVVGVSPDSIVTRDKGPTRPIQTESTRQAVLSNLRNVSYVVLTPTTPGTYPYIGMLIMDALRPNYFITSYGGWSEAKLWLDERNIKLVLTPRLVDTISTTTLIERINKNSI